MKLEISEVEQYILKQEFPFLSLSDDLDIERYFELRRSGFLNEALQLYNKKLKHKYPDEKMRIELMSCYRKKSPRFQELLTENLKQLASKTILKINQIINVFVQKISALDLNDVYNVVQQCELIVSAISKDRFAAISFAEKYYQYSITLNYKTEEMKRSSEIIRAYVTDTISSIKEYRQEQAYNKRKENQLQQSKKVPKAFDFSKIVFTKEQQGAIIIPKSITRVEDKVIAYALKYWEAYSNSGFENAVLLYSRKYKTNHFNIFQAVKIGRMRGWRDEEILQAVLLNIVNGYYYSISGDLYLQRQWNKAKISLKLKEKKKVLALESPKKDTSAENTESKKTKKTPSRSKKIKTAKVKTIKVNRIIPKKKKTKFENNSRKKIVTPKIIEKTKTDVLPIITKSKLQTSKSKKNIIGLRNKISVNNDLGNENTLSIAEMIMELTGSRYKIHKGLFFDNIRKYIRKELSKYNIESTSVFSNEKNIAEDLVFNFFEENYDNPLHRWENSKQCTQLQKIGYNIKNVNTIIKDWSTDV